MQRESQELLCDYTRVILLYRVYYRVFLPTRHPNPALNNTTGTSYVKQLMYICYLCTCNIQQKLDKTLKFGLKLEITLFKKKTAINESKKLVQPYCVLSLACIIHYCNWEHKLSRYWLNKSVLLNQNTTC